MARTRGKKVVARKTKKQADAPHLDALRQTAEAAAKALEEAGRKADALRQEARDTERTAKDAHRQAVAPYREACRKAGVECAFSTGRAVNVSEKVSFEVEKVAKGVRVMVKGKPETEEVIPRAALDASINKAAYAYTDKHIGPKEKVGNKGGSLSNRLRKALAAK